MFALEKNFTSDGEKYKHGVHLAVNFAKEIRGTVIDFDEKLLRDKDATLKMIMDIDRNAEKIERLPGYIDVANFSLTSPKIRVDVIQLVQQYIESKGDRKLKYTFLINAKLVREIDFSEVIMFIENIISNSLKAAATELSIICNKNEDGKVRMDFSDNGRGLAERYLKNPQAIFELGETTTIGGFGIGAFHMKEIVEKIGGIFAKFILPNLCGRNAKANWENNKQRPSEIVGFRGPLVRVTGVEPA